MAYIEDDTLRSKLINILKFKSRNQVVNDLKDRGHKFHQFHIDRFIAGEDVKLSTLKKLDEYVNYHQE